MSILNYSQFINEAAGGTETVNGVILSKKDIIKEVGKNYIIIDYQMVSEQRDWDDEFKKYPILHGVDSENIRDDEQKGNKHIKDLRDEFDGVVAIYETINSKGKKIRFIWVFNEKHHGDEYLILPTR